MSIAATVGHRSLVQLGISMGDIALLIDQGRKFGNWFSTKRNEEELFEGLMEDPKALLKRPGVVDVMRMQSMFPRIELIYHDRTISSEQKKLKLDEKNISAFSWMMVVIVSVLDFCLPKSQIVEFIIDVFVQVLDDPEAEAVLRFGLDVNIESWRSFGQVRKLTPKVRYAFKKAWREKTETEAIPQLNQAEMEEMTRFICDLLRGGVSEFVCISAATFAAAVAIQEAGIFIKATGSRRLFPEQLEVTYSSDQIAFATVSARHHSAERDDPLQLHKGLMSRAQMISYPVRQPESMIHACKAPRETTNRMSMLWRLGSRAAEKFKLHAKADLPFSSNGEFYYELSGDDAEVQTFDALVSIIARKAFPCLSQGVLNAVEELTQGQTEKRKEWLETHIGREFLMSTESTLPSRRQDNLHLWLCYQALVFGFYYQLFDSLVTLDFLSDPNAYFQGLWGYGSTTFLAMCTQFGQELYQNRKVGRSHVLYMLATMYTGRPKWYSSQSRKGLIGVVGQTSILALPLLRTTDVPQELARYAVTDLPVMHLLSEEDELYTAMGSGIVFGHKPMAAKAVQPRGPRKKWSVHSTMRKAFKNGGSGVVMVARCDSRLAGWFNPSAADTIFLSTAYQQRREQVEEKEAVANTAEEVMAVEIVDEHWQEGGVWKPLPQEDPQNAFGLVQSAGCPALRYAAAGFYAEAREEVAIANDDIPAAFGRIEAQDSGIVIC